MNKSIVSSYMIISLVMLLLSCSPNTAELTGVSASSYLIENNNYYHAAYLFDGDDKTSWVEGVSGSGTEEKITIQLNSQIQIKELIITNGFGQPGYWDKNNRVKELEVTNNKGDRCRITLKDIREKQTVTLDRPIAGKGFSFVIKSVYKGSKFNDTALSGISIASVRGPGKSNRKMLLLNTALALYKFQNNKYYEKIKNNLREYPVEHKKKVHAVRNITLNDLKVSYFKNNYAIVEYPTIDPGMEEYQFARHKSLWFFSNGIWKTIFHYGLNDVRIVTLNDDTIPDVITVYPGLTGVSYHMSFYESKGENKYVKVLDQRTLYIERINIDETGKEIKIKYHQSSYGDTYYYSPQGTVVECVKGLVEKNNHLKYDRNAKRLVPVSKI